MLRKVRIKKVPKAKTGYQVDGSLVNDVPAMGGADYNAYIGKPKLRESKYITAVPRDEANLEAEGGETVYGDINGDGMPEHQIIKGPRHHSGGVPLNLPDDTFIFSDTRGMKIKDPEILDMFGKAGTNKAYTPAQLAKQYDIQKYRKILEDPDSDKLDRESAELMIKKFVIKLGCLALAQEAKKGFPQGIPAVAKPCMQAKGITEEQIAPKKEIVDLKSQIEAKYQQQENADETMQDEYSAEQAQELNQGQPVAQPEEQMQQPAPEGMMMHGGYPHRRLRRAEEGMEQVPPEMMPEEQSGDQMMEIVQEIGAALQQGAEPQEVVMSLLQNQLPPEVIVQIFTQLGVPQEQAVGLIQQVIQQMQGGAEEPQGPPMAMYGMQMGGYDMPFYDEPEYEEEIPEADYGMPMGTGMSQNYQGRTKPLIKAGNGIVIDSTGKTEDQIQKEIWMAKNNNPNAEITVTRKDPNTGKVITQTVESQGFQAPSGKDITDLKGFPDTDAGRLAAAQYYLIEKNLKDPKVSAEIIKNTKYAINDPNAWKGKTGALDPNRKWSNLYGADPDEEEIINAALNLNRTNLIFEANEIDPQLYSDVGDKLDTPAKVISEGYKNPKTGAAYTLQEATDAIKFLTDKGWTNIGSLAQGLNVPLDPKGRNRVLQQATMHGYAKTYDNYQKGDYTDPDTKYSMYNFLGNVNMANVGAADESSMGTLYGAMGNKISPLDDTYDYKNNNWYTRTGAGKLMRGQFTTRGDTTSGEKIVVGEQKFVYKDIEDPGCQCDDSTKPNYGRFDPNTKQCNPDLCEIPPVENPCPCIKVDEQGNQTEITQPRNADGTCPPCEEDMDLDIPGPPAEWWLQDTIKTTGAFGDLMGVKKYMPWAPAGELQKPRPAFLDPTRELAANAEQANIQTQGMAQFAGPQALSARSASVQGQTAKNAADVLSKYNNANVNIANQFELKGTDIANQESMLKQANAQRLYDQNTVANQQFDNAKLAMRNNLRNYYTNAITNRWQTDALNQMYPNYKVSPGVGGRMDFNPTEKTTNPSAGTGMTAAEAYRQCRDMNPNATDQTNCVKNLMSPQGKSSTSTGANSKIGMGMYQGQRKKGGAINNPGYIYINSWFPFMD